MKLLHFDANIEGPTTLFRVLREYLARIEFQYVAHPDTKQLITGFANYFFDFSEDREYAIRLLGSFRSNTTSEVSKVQPPP